MHTMLALGLTLVLMQAAHDAHAAQDNVCAQDSEEPCPDQSAAEGAQLSLRKPAITTQPADGITHGGHIYVDPAKIPPASTLGTDQVKIAAATDAPVPSNIGAFRTTCGYSHMAYDDPIVFPGQPGASHLHTFFCNTALDAFTTVENIRTRTGTKSTARGGMVNASGYWVPSMVDTFDGRPIVPGNSAFYYKFGYNLDAELMPMTKAPPKGLRMIAGNAMNAEPAGPFDYHCKGPGLNGGMVQTATTKHIQACPVGYELFQSIRFPQCWDGVNLDSADHKSHMAYPVKKPSGQTGKMCPATHPVILPEIAFRVQYKVQEGDHPDKWCLSSDTYHATDLSKPCGYSAHGDWFNGWMQDGEDVDTDGDRVPDSPSPDNIIGTWTKHCVAASVDCHSHLFGDGRRQVGPP